MICKVSRRGAAPEAGEFYRYASPPFQNYSQAINYFQEAANGGDFRAMKSLAQMLIKGGGMAN
jgi:TPR repeat protein